MGIRRNFTGRTVLISGAAGGIGRALASRFGEAGARLGLLDLDGEGVRNLVDDLKRKGIDSLALDCDLTDFSDCENAVGETLSLFGRIDCLVNNAGISHRSLFVKTDLSVIERVIRVNLLGSINLTKACLPAILERRGLVVAVSTVAGFAPVLGRTGYAASKHGLHGFFDTLRSELGPSGVDVLIACPGFTATPMETNALGGDGKPVTQEKVMVGKVSTPNRVAEEIFQAAARGKQMVVMTGIGKLTRLISRFSPSLYEKMMIKRLGPEFY